ncbi:MAG: glycoside hydrolase family 65 protein [Gammaproteobacteria bacterium]|nr:glycoside hydrolase family 65 protein [Gammaproteobacteria bacterium]
MLKRKKLPKTLKELLSKEEWWVVEEKFDVNKINFYETIFSIGNGYIGSRGSLEATHTAAFPQTFINGIFDHNDSSISHMVNMPDWIPLEIIACGERLCIQNSKLLDYYRILDMHQGLLYRFTRFKDPYGRITRLETIRYISFAEPHLCEIKAIITPENYSGEMIIRSSVEAQTFNLDRIPAYDDKASFDPEVKWHKWAKSKHLKQVVSKPIGKDLVYLEMKTIDRPHVIGYGLGLKIVSEVAQVRPINDYQHISHSTRLRARQGKPIHIEKMLSVYTSREISAENIESACQKTLESNMARDFSDRFAAHQEVWRKKWNLSDCKITGDENATKAVRFSMYHLLIAANEYDPKVNVGAKSMSGEGYKGHIFWDTEIFTLPFYIYTQPETAKSLVMYRYHTLQGARKNAAATGYKGARYPWESADTGMEETPTWSSDGKNRIWPGEEEIHITADVVKGLYTYFNATGDNDFMLKYGAEIIMETARFWESRLEYNAEEDRYELSSVIGPDEYHEHINNNTFTNWMARWNLSKAVELYHWLHGQHPEELDKLVAKIGLQESEVNNWHEMSHKVYVLFDPHTKLFEEFEGFFKLHEVPITKWDENGMPVYPQGFNDFNTGGTMLVKQADVLALLYVLSDEFDMETKRVNYDFYEPKTMHASSLSTSIHAIMSIETRNSEQALKYFNRTAYLDLHDHKNNTESGVHIAAAGGTWQAVVCGFGGMRAINHQLHFNPWLPNNWQKIQFKIQWHGDPIEVTINHNVIDFLWETQKSEDMQILVMDKQFVLRPNEIVSIKYKEELAEIELT